MNLYITAVPTDACVRRHRVCVTERPIEEADLPKLIGIPFVYVKAKTKEAAENEVASMIMHQIANDTDFYEVKNSKKKGKK